MLEFQIDNEYTDMRLDRYVAKACQELSKMTVQKMIRTGRVKLNNKKASADARLAEGDTVKIFIAANEKTELSKKYLPKPDVLYEDDFFIAVNKPSGLISHPDGKKEDSLSDRIVSYLYEELKQRDELFIPGIINRLDINTSGIVLAPKTPSASRALNELMQKNKITKKYLVLVKGDFGVRKKAVHYAVKDHANNKMLLSDDPSQSSEEMITVFEPLHTKNSCTLLSAQLITGKTHQIRAQLAYMGFPVAGDMKYGDTEFNKKIYSDYGLKRQFLHCYCMSFQLWTDFSNIRILCQLPHELQKVLSVLKLNYDIFE